MTQTTRDLHPTGASLVAGQERRDGTDTFPAVDPRTGKPGPVAFVEATDAEVDDAAAAAAEAFTVTRTYQPDRLAALVRAVADELEDVRSRLVEVADAETALGEARLTTEHARACAQLRAFGDLLDEGSYVDAIVDLPDPDAVPPRPDLRRMQVPLGPVAVFGASNFPFAFSVPGGDTAAALAAGCPVVCKAHPAHPGTSELAARAVLAALDAVGAPAGTFSLLQGRRPEVGGRLVTAPAIKAVGFTGSQAAGRALHDLAAARPEPIPVYAEMGSVNPVFVTSAALAARGAEIADGFVASMTMGTGQFCTKPGVVFVPDDGAGRGFAEQVAAALADLEPQPMLNERIRASLAERVATTAGLPGVEVLTPGRVGEGDGFHYGPGILATDGATFLSTPQLTEEHFGPVSIVVRCGSDGDMVKAAAALEGNLTATIHGEVDDPADLGTVRALESTLRDKVGRLVWNGFPTGVAVAPAMHHGGPYPATTAPLHTSVGATAIRRFLRPVVYQSTPQALLPPALRDDNPLGIRRLVNGRWTDEAIGGPGA